MTEQNKNRPEPVAQADSMSRRRLPEPFNGHECDFVSNGIKIGSVRVPKYGHPYGKDVEKIIPWGLSSPFADMLPNEVGIAIGEILALRFLARSLPSTEVPSPDSLEYGLS
jgi:hypothetical protein